MTYGGNTWPIFGAVQSTSSCPPPGAPTLSAPASGSTGLQYPIAFDWADIGDADRYQIQADNNSNFISPELDQQPVLSNYSSNSLPLVSSPYYWRVRGYSNDCGWGAWSSPRSFNTIDATPPSSIDDLEAR